MEPLLLNSRVITVMGVITKGIVIKRQAKRFTDGQYREPLSHERPVYVEWDDGSYGWVDRRFIRPI